MFLSSTYDTQQGYIVCKGFLMRREKFEHVGERTSIVSTGNMEFPGYISTHGLSESFWVNRPKLLDTALGDWENTWRSDLRYLTFSWLGSEKVPNAEVSVNLNKPKGSAVHWPVYYIQDYQGYQRSLTSNFIFLIFNNWSSHQEGWALRPLPILKSKS